MSRNYALGRSFEWRVADAMRDAGWVVIRSAGSRGAADLVCVKPGTCVLIQAKRGGAIGAKEWQEFYQTAMTAGALPILAVMPGVRGIKFHLILSATKARGLNPVQDWSPNV